MKGEFFPIKDKTRKNSVRTVLRNCKNEQDKV